MYIFVDFSLYLQYKRHKTKQHTRNFAKSVVNLVDAVSNPLITLWEMCSVWFIDPFQN